MPEKTRPDRDYRHFLLREENTLLFLRLIIGLVLASGLVYLAAALFVSGESLYRSAGALAVLLCAAAAVVLYRQKRIDAAAQLLVWGIWLSMLLQIFISNGLMSRSLMALPIIIMLAGWLLPPRDAIALCLASLLAGVVLVLGERGGVLPLKTSPSPPLLVWVAYSIYVVLAAALAFFIFRGFRLRQDSLHRMGEDLSARVDMLSARETELRLIMESVPVMLFHGDRDKRCLYANRSYADFYATDKGRLTGRTVREIIGAEAYDAAGVEATLDRVLAGERLTYGGTRRSSPGEDRVLDIDMIPEPDGQGGTQGFFALFRDVTDEVRAGDALRQSESKFASVFRSSPLAVSITRIEDGRYLDVNDAFVRQFGWSREQTIGRTSLELGRWATAEARAAWAAELLLAGRVSNLETDFRTRAGEVRRVLLSAELIDMDGEPCALVMTADITERKRAEAALHESEKRLREAQRIGHVGSWELDLASRRMTWSGELYSIYERVPANFGGTWQDLLRLVHPDDLEILQKVWREAAGTRGSFEVQHRILTPDGRTKHLHVRFEVFRDSDGKPVRAVGLAHDITEQVRAREEIQRLNAELETRVRERTAELQAANRELESFAYSISHDLRAPLRGIDGFSHLLAEEYAERLDETGRSYLERVRRAAQRMGNLIDDILELSRVTRQEMRRVPVDLSQIAAELTEERSRSEPEQRTESVIAPDCKAFGDPQLLRVLMQNLLENAWKYSGKAAAPKIEFGREKNGKEAVFFVRDNGVGFDMKYADRLFSPFQRLHSPEEFEGTGIGLATVARVAHRHGGRVWAESAPGQGALFRFTLGPIRS